MGQSSRSRLTPFGRRLLVDRVQTGGWTPAQAAEAAGVSRQTVYRWLRRFEAEGEAGLEDRSSRPRRCPARLSDEAENAIVVDRLTEREGPHLMAGRLGMPRSTIYAVLARRGLSRLSALDRSTGVPIRYVRDCPGELVHIDIKTLGRVPDGGGWRIHERQNAGPRHNRAHPGTVSSSRWPPFLHPPRRPRTPCCPRTRKSSAPPPASPGPAPASSTSTGSTVGASRPVPGAGARTDKVPI